ncbi:phosphogluconate dehydratase [Crocinitomicaceae bacterium]|nr:phosphogluconate dehydratase [Crocinitomicaceae bacterium]
MNSIIKEVTNQIIARSLPSRKAYLQDVEKMFEEGVYRSNLSCGNLAHAFAGCDHSDKEQLSGSESKNLGLVTAYNDMLSAHKVYENYPTQLREYAKKYNSVLQVAGGVPAMCDGVTQGKDGMELSLFSRDVIALSTSISLSHNVFDAVLCLGICDKIVPGLMMGTLKFGHLPVVFVPGGPMPTGISNDEKAQIRRDFAEGKISREDLLKGESDSYHSPGTCTFYGTANSNQMLMEIMGMQLPGSSFVNPDTEHRLLLNEKAVEIANNNAKKGLEFSISKIITEKSIVNGIIGLLATGGSTNHTIHLIAIAKAAGIIINWDDMSKLSEVIPLITRMYPNGAADVNHFHAAGGMPFVINSLLSNGLLHEDVTTILGHGLNLYTQETRIINHVLEFTQGSKVSLNENVVRSATDSFSIHGGIKILKGNIGRSVIKTAAVNEENLIIEAPAIVFDEQSDLIKAFKNDELNKDFIAIVPFQGPKQNGMPELHNLTPSLTILQKRGFKVGLVTDGRMSGASGKVPAAIHLTPEASDGGVISKIESGDLIKLNAIEGTLDLINFEEINRRPQKEKSNGAQTSLGRNLFENARNIVSNSENGASFIV